MRTWIIAIIALILIAGGMRMVNKQSAGDRSAPASMRVLLLGASVGKAWELPGWPKRMQDNAYAFEMIPVYSFDKTSALEEILMRPRRKFRPSIGYLKKLIRPAGRKPDVLIIKECAAYFPGDLEAQRELVKKWITSIREAGIRPVLATVVSVTEECSSSRPGKLEGLIAYNDWVKTFGAEHTIPVLDLEAAVRLSEENRAMRPELTSGDGVHLNEKAYDILDKYLGKFLQNAL